MKTLSLAWSYLWSRPLSATLNLLLLSLGLASITFLLLVSNQLNKAFERDLQGIDVVVGAKGSPMQLILSGVFHIDVPPGNVPLQAVQALQQHPMVAQVIPISLGDNLHGFRIVGTSLDYLTHYRAQLAQGQLWTQPMQVVLGATAARKLGLLMGNTFVGSHGLAEGGHAHGDSRYTVVGILAPSGSVLDRLILTDTASVWKVHEDYTAVDEEDRAILMEEREVTLALVRYKSPLAAVSFPRYINTSTDMQAAAPALEITRLLRMLGLGTDVLRAFAGVLLLSAGLSVFIALWGAVRERRGDLALLRMLAFAPSRVALPVKGFTQAAVQTAPVVQAAQPVQSRAAHVAAPVATPPAPVVPAAVAVPVLEQIVPVSTAAPVRYADDAPPDWNYLLGRLNVQAMAQQLAKHCVLDSVSEQQVVLRLAQEHKHLQTKMATDNLQTALSYYFARPLKLSVVLGKVEAATPAKIEHQTRETRQQQALDSVASDAFVLGAVTELGATVVPESIKYVNQ